MAFKAHIVSAKVTKSMYKVCPIICDETGSWQSHALPPAPDTFVNMA